MADLRACRNTRLVALLLCISFCKVFAQTPRVQPFFASPQNYECRAEPQTLTIPHQVFERAKKKARLILLLRNSLEDDEKGKLDARREKEIKKIAKELSK